MNSSEPFRGQPVVDIVARRLRRMYTATPRPVSNSPRVAVPAPTVSADGVLAHSKASLKDEMSVIEPLPADGGEAGGDAADVRDGDGGGCDEEGGNAGGGSSDAGSGAGGGGKEARLGGSPGEGGTAFNCLGGGGGGDVNAAGGGEGVSGCGDGGFTGIGHSNNSSWSSTQTSTSCLHRWAEKVNSLS